MDEIYTLTLASNGDVLVGGWTYSEDLPGRANGAQPNLGGGGEPTSDGFVARLSGDLRTLLRSTYLGGSRGDSINTLTLASNGDVLVCGSTSSEDLPGTANGSQPNYDGGGSSADGFIARLSGDLRASSPTSTSTWTPTVTRTPTAEPSLTPTRTPTHTPTRTPTYSHTPPPTKSPIPSPTATSVVDPSPTATTIIACVGDCSGDGEVTVDELILGVNIALENASLQQCPTFDVDGSGFVEINELIVGVNNALLGCQTH